MADPREELHTRNHMEWSVKLTRGHEVEAKAISPQKGNARIPSSLPSSKTCHYRGLCGFSKFV